MIEASIIIPTYNRVEKLQGCLESLCSQTQHAGDFEVLVIVDGSTDGTLQMLSSLRTPFALRVVRQANAGQSAALNRGAAEAYGRICVFLDDDIQVSPAFLTEHLQLHSRSDWNVGIGQLTLTLAPEADWFAHRFAEGWNRHYEELNQGYRKPDWEDCYGGNMSISRAAFSEAGGNATDLRRGYDIELAYRLHKIGCCFEYLPGAFGEQYESKGFRELCADAELAGEASVELARRHPLTWEKLLGRFQENRLAWILLWNLFLTFNLSAQSFEHWPRLCGTRTETFEWAHFIYHYCFWKGVRQTTANREEWNRIIHFKGRSSLA